MNKKEKGIKQYKKSWWCRLGFHKFETLTEKNGSIECGSVILRHEETWIGCVRKNCTKVKTPRKGNWIEEVPK